MVQGQEVGITPPDGLQVPWDQGEIEVRKRFYRPEVLRYSFPPASEHVLLELRPLLPARVLTFAGILLAVASAIPWIFSTGTRSPGDTEAVVTVITDPPGVSISVDDEKKPRGITDAYGRLELRLRTGKKVKLTLAKNRFESHTLAFEPSGHSQTVKTRLDCTKADVLIRTDPGKVAVFLNDTPAGETDGKGELLLEGIDVPKTFRIACKREGFVESTREITIPALERVTLDSIRLAPVAGELSVKATEPDAEVLLDTGDGEYQPRGKTDKNGELLLTGIPVQTKLRIKVVKQGWEEVVLGPVVVPRDRKTRQVLNASMNPATAAVKIVTDPGEVSVKPDNADARVSGSDGGLELGKVTVIKPHSLELSKPGYDSITVELVVPAEYQGKLFTLPGTIRLVKATPKVVKVTMEISPPEVAVHVNESPEPAGISDASGRLTLPLPDSESLLVFKKKGFQTRQIHHKPLPDQPLSVALEPEKVTLVVRTVPTGVSVSVAGTPRGVTDSRGELDVTDLDMGVPVKVSVEKDGYEPTTFTLTPAEIRTQTPVVELSRTPEENSRSLAELITNPSARQAVGIRTEKPDNRFRVGDEIVLHLDVEQDCHLIVVAVDRDGGATVLYPTVRKGSVLVGKGQTIQVPQRDSGAVLRAYPPAGESYVKAVASSVPLLPALSRFIDPKGSFGELNNPVEAFKAMRKRLHELGPEDWSSAGLVVEVVE